MTTRLLVLIALLMFYAPGAQAATILFEAVLTGGAEIPPNASPGTGSALVTLDLVDLDTITMRVEADFQDLIGNTTAAHIHCCTVTPGSANVGVATTLPTFTGFPLGVTSGTYDHTFDMTLSSSYSAAFITAQGGSIANALAALQAGMTTGNAYFNIHTTSFGGGEIRGLLREVTAVPEPATILLTVSGLAGAGLRRWRKRRRI